MNKTTEELLEKIALELKVDKNHLWALIQHESGWNPQAKNPYSSARGLLQWLNVTAQELGYKTSDELINKLSTVDQQLQHAVLPYLKNRMPFNSPQSLFMAIFYPRARNWPDFKEFPLTVQAVNPGIKTPNDYIKRVYKKLALLYVPHAVIFLTTVTAFFF